MNALLDETKTERIDLGGFPCLPMLRVSPTVRAILEEEKPAHQSWGDFLTFAAIHHVVHARTVRGDFRGANRLLVRLVGEASDETQKATREEPKTLADLTNVRTTDERQKPVQMGLPTGLVKVGKRSRA